MKNAIFLDPVSIRVFSDISFPILGETRFQILSSPYV